MSATPVKFVKQPKFGLAFDCETSGAYWGNLSQSVKDFQVLQWAFIVFEMSTLKEVDRLFINVKYDKRYQWTDSAAKVHGLTIPYLEANGVSEYDAAEAIGNLILKYFGPTDEINALGHNVDFDIKFLSALMEKFGVPIKFSHRKFDTCSAGWIALGVYNSNELFEMCGLPERKFHNAMEDIEYTLEAARIIRSLASGI